MKKNCIMFVLLAALVALVGTASAQSFGVNPTVAPKPPIDTVGPTIAQDMAQEGFVPTGPDGTLVPATTRGFDPGNGSDTSFGALSPLETPKAQ